MNVAYTLENPPLPTTVVLCQFGLFQDLIAFVGSVESRDGDLVTVFRRHTLRNSPKVQKLMIVPVNSLYQKTLDELKWVNFLHPAYPRLWVRVSVKGLRPGSYVGLPGGYIYLVEQLNSGFREIKITLSSLTSLERGRFAKEKTTLSLAEIVW